MATADLQAQLQPRGIELAALLSSGPAMAVHRGKYCDKDCVVKLLQVQRGADLQRLQQESDALKALSHPNIAKIYDSLHLQISGDDYIVLVVEWGEKDLAKEIAHRRKTIVPWVIGQLWSIVRSLVSALAYMQQRGFAHRDVKPESIFLTPNSDVKVSDFNSGKFKDPHSEFTASTLVGTPLFMSPKVREAFLAGARSVVHNEFKSDVYSLGLTLLCMAGLLDQTSLASLVTSQDALFACVDGLKFSAPLKTLLKMTLQWDEEKRADFIDLAQWLRIPIEPGAAESPTRWSTGNAEILLSPRTQQARTAAFSQPEEEPKAVVNLPEILESGTRNVSSVPIAPFAHPPDPTLEVTERTPLVTKTAAEAAPSPKHSEKEEAQRGSESGWSLCCFCCTRRN